MPSINASGGAPVDLVREFLAQYDVMLQTGNDCCFVMRYNNPEETPNSTLSSIVRGLLDEIDVLLSNKHQVMISPLVIDGICSNFTTFGASDYAIFHARSMVECKTNGYYHKDPQIKSEFSFYRVIVGDKLSYHVKLQISTTFSDDDQSRTMIMSDVSYVLAHVKM
jgi:hypothetical protein